MRCRAAPAVITLLSSHATAFFIHPAFSKSAICHANSAQPLRALESDYDLSRVAKAAPQKSEYDLFGDSRKPQAQTPSIKEDPYEVLLAEFIFTTEDVRTLIYQRLDQCDQGFVDFLQNRITASTDLDERTALGSLIDIIDSVKVAVERRKVEDAAQLEAERKQQLEKEAQMLAEMAEAKRQREAEEIEQRQAQAKRKELQSTQGESKPAVSAMESAQSYEQMLEALLGLDSTDQAYMRQVVEANYERFTIEFLDLLGARLNAPDVSTVNKKKMLALKGHIEAILQERMTIAAGRLQTVVKAGPMEAMVEKIYELNEEGKIDEPLLLLLESNLQQAERAKAGPASEVFRNLIATAREAMDETRTPVRRLLRRLLRMDDTNKRKDLLNEAFRPKATALTADGAKTDPRPEVAPPGFIDELRQLLKNFGNIETADFNNRLRAIAEEAEEVSIGIYGTPMTQREQQEYMWQKASMSVFDLEKMEHKAESSGDQMPWQNDKYDNVMTPGFEGGVRTIGGNDKNQF